MSQTVEQALELIRENRPESTDRALALLQNTVYSFSMKVCGHSRLVGPSGRVIAVDVQPKMIDRLKRRAAKAGLLDRVDARVAPTESMGIMDLHGSIDFTLAFAVVHEFPDAGRFFAEVAAASKSGATVLVSEPSGHVKTAAFDSELRDGAGVGLRVVDRPSIRRSHAALLKKS